MGAFLFSYEIDSAGFVFDHYVLYTFLVFAVQRPVNSFRNVDLEPAAFHCGRWHKELLRLRYGGYAEK